MKQAGCILLALGIESSSQKILNRARKGTQVGLIRRGVQLAKEAGIPTMGNVIFGLPGETEATAKQTIEHLCDLEIDYLQCYCAVPYPKTPLGEMARQRGWIKTVPWSGYDFGGPSIMNTDTITAEQVTAFRDEAFRRFYLRPGKVWRILRRFRSIKDFGRIPKFMRWMRARSHQPVQLPGNK